MLSNLSILLILLNDRQLHSVNAKKYLPIMGMLIGAIVFFSIYGNKILDPTFIKWTLQGDASQNYLGWHFFRSEPWTFPLGVIKSYRYPQGTSIIFTDSIPLLAFPLKLISGLLPSAFQYHGIWLFLCYILQGYFAILLLRLVTENPIIILLSLLFFLLSPIIAFRAGGHEALSAHWIILASLYLYYQKYDFNIRVKWIILLVIAVMVHFYLFIMVYFILSAYLLKLIIKRNEKGYFSIIKFFLTTIVTVLISMWLIGYFILGISNGEGFGLGYYSMNLLAPINPTFYTHFLKKFPLATQGQYEGFNYLGFGLLLLILISIYELFRQKKFLITKTNLPLIIIALILFTISISNKITLSNRVLYSFTYPDFINSLLSIIRATGRMFWPITYMLILGSITVLIRNNTSKRVILLLCIFVSFQLLDLYPWYETFNLDKDVWISPLQSPLWDRMMEKCDHIVLIPATKNQDDCVPFALLAAKHKKTINVGSVARINKKNRKIYVQNLRLKFKKRELSNNTLYIILQGKYLYKPKTSSKYFSGILDGYNIIVSKTSKIKDINLLPWPINVIIDRDKYTLYSLIKKYLISDYAILLSVRDEASANIPKKFVRMMRKIGSNIKQLQYRGSYAAIIINGNLKIEKINNYGKVHFGYQIPNYKIDISSAGLNYGNKSEIAINKIPLSTNRRGFNVVIMNLKTKKVKRYCYDTFLHNCSKRYSE